MIFLGGRGGGGENKQIYQLKGRQELKNRYIV